MPQNVFSVPRSTILLSGQHALKSSHGQALLAPKTQKMLSGLQGNPKDPGDIIS